MNVTIIIPAQVSEAAMLARTLDGVFGQRYDGGRVEVLVVQYGGGGALDMPQPKRGFDIRLLTVQTISPYSARNAAASHATGEVFLFTEPGCVPDAEWIHAHVQRLDDTIATISVGSVSPARSTALADTFLSYENVRDVWVFSSPKWQHYFGRPKNMAVTRHRFESHGPFAEVMRGADSSLVQRVAREISCNEIALTPAARVRQVSVRGVPSLFSDRFTHARMMRIHASSHSAPIPFRDRIALFRETCEARHYSALKRASLLLLLSGGILVFRTGGLAGGASKRFHRQTRLSAL